MLLSISLKLGTDNRSRYLSQLHMFQRNSICNDQIEAHSLALLFFATSRDQQRIADAYIEKLNNVPMLDDPIVTSLSTPIALQAVPLGDKNYASRHPDEIQHRDSPRTKEYGSENRLPRVQLQRMTLDGALPD